MQLTPLIIPWLISAILTFSMGVYTIRRRKHVASIPFALMCFFAALWAGSYIFELGGITLPTKLWALKIGYIGVVGTPLSWAAFALSYSGYAKWLTRRNILLALIFPALTLFVIFTNEFHHWFFARTGLYIHPISGLITLYDPFGWWFWMHALYAYIFLLFGTYLLLHEYWSKKDIYRSQIFANVLAIFFPWISNGIILLGIFPLPFDITAIAFSISISILGWSFLRYGFLDLLPVAHRAIVESISDAVIVLDTDLRIVDLNPAALELFRLNGKVVIGKSFESVFQPQIQIDQRALRQHGYHKQIAFESEGQPVKWFDLHINTLRDLSTQGGHIITLRNMTILKRNEEALASARDEAVQANNFKTQLLANVSHELRTPLSVILGYVDLLTRKSYGELTEKQISTLERIKDSTQYLNRLVSELLDQAQLDSGRIQLEERSFEPREAFGSVCKQMSVLVDAKALKFEYLIADNMPASLWGDSQRLKQILVNLIGNAVKFTESGGINVYIAALPSLKQWTMQISDTGTGIPPEALASVFEPFRQLDNAHKSSYRKGYGLGLSITKQFVQLMGGDIAVESVLGEKTTFTITLPLIIESETL